MQNGTCPPLAVVTEARSALNRDPDHWLADLYARLVRPANRRHLGTFFTPAPEVGLMLDMWNAHQPPPEAVVDVGAGVGVFTAAAATEWPDAAVHAVDVNPVTLGLLAVRLYATCEPRFANVQLVHADYTEWIQGFNPGTRKLVLGNPPYTRAQLLPIAERRRFQSLTQGLCGSRASLSSVITAISLLALESNDGLCLLLPAQWLESDYAADLRTQLWDSTQRRIELRLVESALFDDAQVDAVALLVGAEQQTPGLFVSKFSAANTARQINKSAPAPTNWRRLFSSDSPQSDASRDAAVPGGMPVLGDLAKIKRGIATGANAFFALGAEAANDLNLGDYFKRPVVSRLRDFPDADIIRADDPALTNRLLEVKESDLPDSTDLENYIGAGIADGIDQRHLCRQRRCWYDLRREVFVPDLIIGPMSRSKFRIVANHAGAAITNNLYGLNWEETTTPEVRQAVLKWLRSWRGQAALQAVARNQSDGLLKIEPKAIQQLQLPKTIAILQRRSANGSARTRR